MDKTKAMLIRTELNVILQELYKINRFVCP